VASLVGACAAVLKMAAPHEATWKKGQRMTYPAPLATQIAFSVLYWQDFILFSVFTVSS